MIFFLTFCSLTLKVKRRSKTKQASSIFKNNENRGGICLYNSTTNQLFQTLVFIRIFGEPLISMSQTHPKQYKQNEHVPEVHAEVCQTECALDRAFLKRR